MVVVIRYIQVDNLASPRNLLTERYTSTKTSCAISSASCILGTKPKAVFVTLSWYISTNDLNACSEPFCNAWINCLSSVNEFLLEIRSSFLKNPVLCLGFLYSFQFYRICFSGIPLRNVQIFIIINANIVRVQKGVSIINRFLQNAIFINWFFASRKGKYLIVFI